MSVKLLAVSGGIDSMVMLDFLVRRFPEENFVVATVDHGTRASSALDAEFVGRVARERYGLRCAAKRLELGEGASEETAREARYATLDELGRELSGGELGDGFEIWTAQHLDDLVESVAINCLRGTGWRGLTPMRRAGVRRPFLELDCFLTPVDKGWILRYAAERGVSWREDPTNQSEDYLRNRVRPVLRGLAREEKLRLYKLWKVQDKLRGEIDDIVVKITTLFGGKLARGWFLVEDSGGFMLDDTVADEILRAWLSEQSVSATRPQRADFLAAIRNYRPGKLFNLPGDRMAKIGTKVVTLLGRE